MNGRRPMTGALLACVTLLVTAACTGSTGSTVGSTAGSSGAAATEADSSSPTSAVSGPATQTPSAPSSAPASALPEGWVDDEATFQVDGVSVHGTFRHPSRGSGTQPAALLIAGSGPTDRNGNSRLLPGSVDTLANLAGVLSADGVASLRYDKLGSGTTGLGPFAQKPNDIGLDVFTHEAQAALHFLATRPGIDRDRLSVYGHSEGALFALLLTTGDVGSATPVPAVHSVGLLEPLSQRYLDLITEQVEAQAAAQLTSGVITQAQSDELTKLLHQAVTSLRAKGTVAANLPYGLNTLFAPSSLKFLREADRVDPARLAAKLPKTMPVLVTCSDADIQVSCTDVRALADAVASSDLDFARLKGVSHVLKEDPSRTPANYAKDLPFSSQLTTALGAFDTR